MKDFKSYFKYDRRKTVEVGFGDIKIGGRNPIRVESMTNTNTRDVNSTVNQCVALFEVGCEIIRMTAPSIKDVDALEIVSKLLRQKGINVPLVADIHFTPNAALRAAEVVENVRINPGNYSDKKKFLIREYSEKEYDLELQRIHNVFKPLVLKCKEYGKSLRIGVNHGSLSDRIMNRYGDTPLGMVQSALEFIKICEAYNYYEIVISMKSSIPQIMVQAYRLLVEKLQEENLKPYPLHLGVTEAGDGQEARVKSSIGIGSLLEDGLGDTIRVSLTEDPVNEIPVCKEIVKKYNNYLGFENQKRLNFFNHSVSDSVEEECPFNPFEFQRRVSSPVSLGTLEIGKENTVPVEVTLSSSIEDEKALQDEIIFSAKPFLSREQGSRAEICNVFVKNENELEKIVSYIKRYKDKIVFSVSTSNLTVLQKCLNDPMGISKVRFLIEEKKMLDRDILDINNFSNNIILEICFVKHKNSVALASETLSKFITHFKQREIENVIFSIFGENDLVFSYRKLWSILKKHDMVCPIGLYYKNTSESSMSRVLVEASIELGSLLMDGLGDTVLIETNLPRGDELNLIYDILQGTRRRITKTEFISCPSCGRTLFNLEEVTKKIKTRTCHLKELKIGIMGCIVNGPGEMADADFGYVGTGVGKVSLYVGKACVERDIPQESAVERLIELIKKNNKWRDPDPV